MLFIFLLKNLYEKKQYEYFNRKAKNYSIILLFTLNKIKQTKYKKKKKDEK